MFGVEQNNWLIDWLTGTLKIGERSAIFILALENC